MYIFCGYVSRFKLAAVELFFYGTLYRGVVLGTSSLYPTGKIAHEKRKENKNGKAEAINFYDDFVRNA